MRTVTLPIAIMLMLGSSLHAEQADRNTTLGAGNSTTQNIKVESVRGIVGGFDPLEHSKGQIRAGYITLSPDIGRQTSDYAIGGHYHFDTKRWNGLKFGASVYTVLNMGINQNADHMNGDFFDDDRITDLIGKSFTLFCT